jgi:hypothetical protein
MFPLLSGTIVRTVMLFQKRFSSGLPAGANLPAGALYSEYHLYAVLSGPDCYFVAMSVFAREDLPPAITDVLSALGRDFTN